MAASVAKKSTKPLTSCSAKSLDAPDPLGMTAVLCPPLRLVTASEISEELSCFIVFGLAHGNTANFNVGLGVGAWAMTITSPRCPVLLNHFSTPQSR
jgi:hypothetical protein